MSIIIKALSSLGLRLLSEKLIEELILWGLEKLAKSSKTRVDDELLEMAKRHLGK